MVRLQHDFVERAGMGNVRWGDLNNYSDDMDDDEVKEVVRWDFDSHEEEAVFGNWDKKDRCPNCFLIHKGECL